MTFTVTPEILIGLLNQIGQDRTSRQRARLMVTMSAGERQVSIIGNGMAAGVSIPVQDQGQCTFSWRGFASVLATFPANKPVLISCKDNRLQIASFSMLVLEYKPEAVPQEQAIPAAPPIIKRASAKKKATPATSGRDIPADGYSLPPAAPKDNDCTGQPGKVLPADTEAPREPVMCPVCQSVGYFKKREFRGRFYYDHQRSWAVAKDAPRVAVLKGDVATGLCPPCLLKRLQGARHIDPVEGEQADIFEAAPAKVP